jgi:hypothetical protein
MRSAKAQTKKGKSPATEKNIAAAVKSAFENLVS